MTTIISNSKNSKNDIGKNHTKYTKKTIFESHLFKTAKNV